MKIIPLEIRQREFEKKLRGYDKDEVKAYLLSLSNEWERMLDENRSLNQKLAQAEKEVSKLREVEGSLYKTLKTAEITGANMIDQANKAAELHMKETKMNAEVLLKGRKNKARTLIEKAEVESRHILEELKEEVRRIEQNYRDILNLREITLQELKNLSVTLIEKVEKNTKESREFRFDEHIKRVKKLARESEERFKLEKVELDDNLAQSNEEENTTEAEAANTTSQEDAPTHTSIEENAKVEAQRKNLSPEKTDPLFDTQTKKEEKEKQKIASLRIAKTISFFDEVEKSKSNE